MALHACTYFLEPPSPQPSNTFPNVLQNVRWNHKNKSRTGNEKCQGAFRSNPSLATKHRYITGSQQALSYYSENEILITRKEACELWKRRVKDGCGSMDTTEWSTGTWRQNAESLYPLEEDSKRDRTVTDCVPNDHGQRHSWEHRMRVPLIYRARVKWKPPETCPRNRNQAKT